MHERYMERVLELAREVLEEGELPIAAAVVAGGKIIAEATTAERREGRLLVHAELLALDAADRLRPFPGRRRDATLYTNLEPCLMCLGAAMSCQIGTVCYALESPSDGAVGLASGWRRDEEDFPAYRLPHMVGGVLRRESAALFSRYVEIHDGGPVWEWARSLALLGRRDRPSGQADGA